MLKIEILNLKEVQELISDMRFEKLGALEPYGADSLIGTELYNWQAEDMRRQFPEIEIPDPRTFVTHIYPRSRKQRTKQPAHTRGRRMRRPVLHIRRTGGKRRILRPELLEKLEDRMAKLLKETLTWR